MNRPPMWIRPDPLPLPLATGRTVLDWYEDDDAPALFAAISGSRAALLPWLPWAGSDHTSVDVSLEELAGLKNFTFMYNQN